MDDENVWLAEELSKLGIDDSSTMADYLQAIIEANNGETTAVAEALEAYSLDEHKLKEFIQVLSEKLLSKQPVAQAPTVNSSLFSREAPLEHSKGPTNVVTASLPTIDAEGRAATLRLVKQMHEKHLEEEIAQEKNDEEEESIASQNRSLVQSKIRQATVSREAVVQQKKQESRAAATADRKSKEAKKQERQRKAQKGERKSNA